MTRKEWREVLKQSLVFLLAMAAMVLLVGIADRVQGRPVDGERVVILLGLWLLMFSLFMGLLPFAMDSKQKGMEYLLTLPVSRRRLLFTKLLPRLAAVVFFYAAFVPLYAAVGHGAFGGGAAFFSLAYFALFVIAFSLSLVHENFIVQSLWAGIAWIGYLALCLFVVLLGFSWKFKMPASQVGPRIWHDLSYDVPTLIAAIVVFLLMAMPFIASFFLAFKNFDLKPVRAFNRRHLLIFVPLLLSAFAVSLGITYLVQSRSPYWESDLFILKDQRLLKADFPGKLALVDASGRQRIDTQRAVFWERLLLEQGERLYLSGYDIEDGTRIIGCLNRADRSWRILHRVPERYFVANGAMGLRYDGMHFVYLRRYAAEAERPGMDSQQAVKSGVLQLVRVDPAGGESRTITFRSPLFRKYYQPWFVGSDERNGQRFWLVAHQWHNVLRLWEDGRAEDLGLSKGLPVYAGGLLFSRGDRSLVVRRLLDAGGESVKEIEGTFKVISPYHSSLLRNRMNELYVERDKRIVRIDLATLAVADVGPLRGHVWMVDPGDFYFVEVESWPGRNTDRWNKLYRLQNGRMVLLKRFDFADAGTGHLVVNENGVILRQVKMKNAKAAKWRMRAFTFPDLRELEFEGMK